jgi:hypothetical protein
MARGWESKAVEEQMSAQETTVSPAPNKKKTLSPFEVQQRAKRDSLILARKRTVATLQITRDVGYREMLERALEHLDSQLAAFGVRLE